MIEYCDAIRTHYVDIWKSDATERKWPRGPIDEIDRNFRVFEFAPTAKRPYWVFATCCMSHPAAQAGIELHLFSPIQTDLHIELLTTVVHFHQTHTKLGLGHTVNFGRGWLPGSRCTYGLISLPYVDGPLLQEFGRASSATNAARCLWLIPITAEERKYKKESGLEELEVKFEEAQFNYLDPDRPSVV